MFIFYFNFFCFILETTFFLKNSVHLTWKMEYVAYQKK